MFALCRISEMYVADESHTDEKIPVQVDVVFPKMQCICKLFIYFLLLFLLLMQFISKTWTLLSIFAAVHEIDVEILHLCSVYDQFIILQR